MKVRDSGMPDELMWEVYFDPHYILTRLGFNDAWADVVDLGCGYGTFTIPAARSTSGIVYALDIDPEMLRITPN